MAKQRYHGLCDRLWANCRVSERHFFRGTPCWDWTGKTIPDRSGQLAYPVYTIRLRGHRSPSNRRAHRASLEVFCGIKLRRGHEANHLCGRTICISPLHLERATRSQNMLYKRIDTFDIGEPVYSEECPF